MNYFNTFGSNSDPVQLMYRSTANFKWYCAILGNYGCTPLQKLYESGLRSHIFDADFNPFGGKSDPVQLIYGRTAYFKYSELALDGHIHFV